MNPIKPDEPDIPGTGKDDMKKDVWGVKQRHHRFALCDALPVRLSMNCQSAIHPCSGEPSDSQDMLETVQMVLLPTRNRAKELAVPFQSW